MQSRMIEVDISNVWGELALPDLLAMERNVFDAHMRLTEEEPDLLPFREDAEELLRIRRAAEKIRANSGACLVVGADSSCQGVRAAMELLQGTERNAGRKKGDPQIFFAGDSFSTRKWKGLTALLEGTDISVIVISGTDMAPETAVAFRSLRWMLERKYGTDEAGARIYAVTDSEQGVLRRMAQEAGWETFPHGGILSAAGLLPLAVAGFDIGDILQGAAEAWERYDLRSYENPVWLYAAVRSLLRRGGERIELPAAYASGFRGFGLWWQGIFRLAGGFPAAAEFPADLHILEQPVCQPRFETLLRFAPGTEEVVIGSDWKDLDGLNSLAGNTLASVEEQAYWNTVAAHGDAGIPVITMDCGPLQEHTLGELLCFLELARGISQRLPS